MSIKPAKWADPAHKLFPHQVGFTAPPRDFDATPSDFLRMAPETVGVHGRLLHVPGQLLVLHSTARPDTEGRGPVHAAGRPLHVARACKLDKRRARVVVRGRIDPDLAGIIARTFLLLNLCSLI